MERAKRERRALRGVFSKSVTKLEQALSAQSPESTRVAYDNLVDKRQKLLEVDNKIFSLWLDSPDQEEEFERDLEATEVYNDKWYSMNVKYKEATSVERDRTLRGEGDDQSNPDKLSRLLKLPKLELPKFNGDLKTWIHFWGMFEKIHNDNNMEDDIKFQYLAQCMEPGSPPHKLVSSYPPTAANYSNAIEQLKERFGRDELLIEIYVRELLTLILEQNKSGSIPIGALYDKLKSQLNALESLGVTSDRYAAMLRPLVESALPVDLLRVWERRSREYKENSELLTSLLDFIKLEVESEERIMISRPGCSTASEPSTSCFTTGVKETESSASDKRKCIFCDKATTHASSECNKAIKMSLQDRKDFVKSCKACFICLVPGHTARRCRNQPRCLICTKRHVTLLCENAANKDGPIKSDPNLKIENNEKQLVALYQSTIATTVLLPTLVLDVVHKGKSAKVRALLDSGAQRSFIKASIAQELNLKPYGEAQISHNLFGGVVTKKEVHKSYQVTLKSVERKFESTIEVLEQEVICKSLPKANRDVIDALKEKGVHLSDKENGMGEVALLIGADFLGALMTGKVITLKDNLIAIETRFGWSVQGPTAGVESTNINVNTASFDVEDLWKLETVGIVDDGKNHNKIDNEIKDNTITENWRHVPGNINPADLPSRGCTAKGLLKSKWWECPDWLKKPSSEWPHVEVKPDIEEINKEVKAVCLSVQLEDKFSNQLTYFAKHSKTVRTLAWCTRFIQNCRNKAIKRPKITGDITAEAYETAEKLLFKIIQREEFTDVQNLKKRLNMELFQDKDKILRVKTRLTMRDDEEDFIFPILLPSSNFLIENFVRQCHVQLCHAGSLTLISKLREHVWIIGIRLLSKKIVRKCTICRRYSAKKCAAPLAPLPTDRTLCGGPFDVTGIDYAGPIQLRNKEKCWIALFTCATYRAIHLELCRGLSTEEFILALRRFIARRGRPTSIYTDNGTNFTGTERALRTLDWSKIETETSVLKIRWHFSPPSAPWWGGFWERLVKTVKESLRRILGKAAVDAVTLETVLCEVESVVNSRPLSGLSGETNEVAALTPAMFLLPGIKTQETPGLDLIDLHASNKRVQALREQLKARFRSEYLSLLKQKVSAKTRYVKAGDVVIVETQNKRVMWPLARVVETFMGPDGHTRVAKIKTAHGELVRPIQRLYNLELSRAAGAAGAAAAAGGC